MRSATTRWVKGLRDLTYEERIKALKLQSLEMLFIHLDMDATQLVKSARRADYSIKPREPTEDETVLHAGLLITGTV